MRGLPIPILPVFTFFGELTKQTQTNKKNNFSINIFMSLLEELYHPHYQEKTKYFICLAIHYSCIKAYLST